MTQEQEDFFYRKIDNRAPLSHKMDKWDLDKKKMFLALVETLIEFDPPIIFEGTFCWRFMKLVESASGLPWSEVRGIYKECVG